MFLPSSSSFLLCSFLRRLPSFVPGSCQQPPEEVWTRRGTRTERRGLTEGRNEEVRKDGNLEEEAGEAGRQSGRQEGRKVGTKEGGTTRGRNEGRNQGKGEGRREGRKEGKEGGREEGRKGGRKGENWPMGCLPSGISRATASAILPPSFSLSSFRLYLPSSSSPRPSFHPFPSLPSFLLYLRPGPFPRECAVPGGRRWGRGTRTI